MGKQIVSERHKPSFLSYIWKNIKTTFAFTEKAESMVSLGLIFISVILGFIGGFSVTQISDALTSWQWRFGIGVGVFVVILFGIITPFRMWRKSTWVANIERMLEDLWDSHDKGVELLNDHPDFNFIPSDGYGQPDSKKVNDWVTTWVTKVNSWNNETQKKLSRFYPIEGRRFKNIVVYQHILQDGNLNPIHRNYRNMLLGRLQMLEKVIERHQPALLPE